MRRRNAALRGDHTPQDGLPFDSSMLRTVVRQADQNAGTYRTIEAGGDVRVGDAVTLVAA